MASAPTLYNSHLVSLHLLVRQHQRVFRRLQPPQRPPQQAVQPVVVLLLQRQLGLLVSQPLLQLQLLQFLRFVLDLRSMSRSRSRSQRPPQGVT
jgi:hypothetical protein